jgi:thioredoxin
MNAFSIGCRNLEKGSFLPIIFFPGTNPFSYSIIVCLWKQRIHEQRRKNMSEQLNKETFKEKIFNFEKNKEWKYEGTLPALVDFWAPWCGPCRMVGPVIDELSQEYTGKVNFYKVNTDEEQELAGMFGIQSIPSLLFIPVNGKPQMAMGALPKKELKRIIESELIPSAAEQAVS